MVNTPTKKILWIDDEFVDELHSLVAYVDELEKTGEFQVIKIADPDSALQRLENLKDRFDCIILDIMLPHGTKINRMESQNGNTTGINLGNVIRGMPRYTSIPIVYLTGVRRDITEKHMSDTENSFGDEIEVHYKADVSLDSFTGIIQSKLYPND